MVQLLGRQASDTEQASLLDFRQEGSGLVFAVGDLSGDLDGNFEQLLTDLLVLGIQLQRDLRLERLGEDRRRIRGFEGHVLHVDALQGKLELILSLFCACCSLCVLFFSHETYP